MADDLKIRISELTDYGDQRGFSFTVPAEALEFLAGVEDIHIAQVRPQAVRGNHYHQRRREVLVFLYTSEWSFHWDDGPGTPAQHKSFRGSGAVMVTVLPGASHAVRNDGDQTLTLMAASSEPYDPQDSIARNVL
jgi:dTDP-4-dehydrorhamnose 3,5-epimerase-like enzyme